MNFDLVRPCANCPFRTDVPGYLRRERAQEIAEALMGGSSFPCHKTTETVEEDDGSSRVATADSQMCAGAMIVLERMEQPNQIMRIAERTHVYDHNRLDMGAPVHGTLAQFVWHHGEDEEQGEPCSASGPGCLAPAGFLVNGTAVPNAVDPDATEVCPECGEYVCEACDCRCTEEGW